MKNDKYKYYYAKKLCCWVLEINGNIVYQSNMPFNPEQICKDLKIKPKNDKK